MSTPRRAFAVLVLSASIATPVLIADPTVNAPQQAGGQSSPNTCGNGNLQPSKGEICDDGNNLNGDGCSADCRSQEFCGNGIVDGATGEQCDTGGQSSTCNSDCTVAYCGDGKVNASRGESCDTAGPSSTCNVFCQPPVCGNGVVDLGEQCDDANVNNEDTCTSQCRFNCALPSSSITASSAESSCRFSARLAMP